MKKNLLFFAGLASLGFTAMALTIDNSADVTKVSRVYLESKAEASLRTPLHSFAAENALNAPIQKTVTGVSGIDTLYRRPNATFFYFPYNDTGNAWILAPGNADITFKNCTTGWTAADSAIVDNATYQWAYSDGTTKTATTKDLTYSHPNANGNIYPAPMMGINNGDAYYQSSFKYMYGGSLPFYSGASAAELTAVDVTVANYNMWSTATDTINGISAGYPSLNKNSNYTSSTDFWTSYLKTAATLKAVGEVIEKPARPYALSSVTFRAYLISEAGAKIGLTVYKFNDNGNLEATPLAQYEQTLTDAIGSLTAGSLGRKEFTFNFTGTDDQGLPTEEPLIVDSKILVAITGIYDDSFVSEFRPMAINHTSNYTSMTKERNINCLVQTESGIVVANAGYTKWFNEGRDETKGLHCLTSLYMNFGISYDYLETEQSTSITIPTTGGSQEITISANRSGDNWSYAGANSTDVPDWIDLEANDVIDTDYPLLYSGETKLKITVPALPTGETGRGAAIDVKLPSSTLRLYVNQGTSGVESVGVTSAANVAVVGGNFVVTAPESINGVTVYNVAGQTVATAAIDGETTIAAQDLANGVYILKFNDGSSVKVIK